MQAIAQGLVGAAISSETRARRPVAVALVRELVMRQCPDGYARTCEALAAAEAADVGRIACPTLLVTGDEDAIAPAQSVRHIGARIAGSRVEVLPRLRALDAGGETGGVRRARAAVLRSKAVMPERETAGRREVVMGNTLFTNVRILDGSGAQPYRRRGARPGQPHRARRPRHARACRSAAPR